MKIMITLLFSVFLFVNLSLRSETILLKSGEKLEGKILAQDKDSVTFKLVDGNTKVFLKSAVRKVSYAKGPDSSSLKKNLRFWKRKRKSKRKKNSQRNKTGRGNLKAKEEKQNKREEQLAKAKRHYLEGSFGVGGGESQSELRPFFQAIQYAGLLFSSGGQAELQSTPYKSYNFV